MALSQRDRRLVIILGAVAAVLIVYLAFTTLTGGGSQTLGTGPPVGPPATSPTPSVTPSPEVTPPVNIVGGRDPFSIPAALCPPASTVAPTATVSPGATSTPTGTPAAGAAGCGTPAATSPSSTPSITPSTKPTPTGGGNGGGGNGGGGGTPGSTTNVGGNSVSLLDVFTRNGKDVAQVRVNSSVYTVSEGERFHQNYELVSIAGRCGDFLYGDSSFTLCATSHK